LTLRTWPGPGSASPQPVRPGGDDRHAGPPDHVNLRDADSASRRHRRTQHSPDVSTVSPRARPRRRSRHALRGDRAIDLENVAALARVFHMTTRRRRAQHTAVAIRSASPAPTRSSGTAPMTTPPRIGQVGRLRFGRAEGVHGGNGVPVHDCPGEMRHIDCGNDIGGERAPSASRIGTVSAEPGRSHAKASRTSRVPATWKKPVVPLRSLKISSPRPRSSSSRRRRSRCFLHGFLEIADRLPHPLAISGACWPRR